MQKRTAREISVENKHLNNNNINVKIGAVENRDNPETVYINISFWVKPIMEKTQKAIKYNFEKKLNKMLHEKIANKIKKNNFFPYPKKNIYIVNIPESFNYNDKYNFITMELHLHTLNINSLKKYPLNLKKDKTLFIECLKISNLISKELINMEKLFDIKSRIRSKKKQIKDF
jgi:hypothetical protein